MLSRTVDLFLGIFSLGRRSGGTLNVSDNVDVATDRDLTVFDSERLQADESGDVAGNTAFIEDNNLVPSGGKLPPRYNNSFLSGSSA
jgi:hypothetical protein